MHVGQVAKATRVIGNVTRFGETFWSPGWDSEGGATIGNQVSDCLNMSVADAAHELSWYAVQTRSRHEKLVARQLQEQGVITFLPLTEQLRQWSDRRKLVELPLFPGYAFVHLACGPEERLKVLRTEGVVGFVGANGQGVSIPEKQIEGIQAVLAGGVSFQSHPFLKVGQRVRIRGGSLDGTEGILTGHNGDRMLVVSVELIQRSVSIRLHGYNVEPV